jgi:DNA-binding NtrC family response regulator
MLRSLSGRDDVGVFVMTAFGSMESAVEAFRLGAVDYLLKPVTLDEVEGKIRRFLSHKDALSKLRLLRRELSHVRGKTELVGNSRGIAEVHELVKQVGPVRTTVLLVGETGTGKEITTRLIHESSPWQGEPCVAVNCAALPETLLESELFGHVQGAYTGAVRDRVGLFEAAQNGTLFLDEISELSPSSQAKLLRAVEQKQITRLGSTEPRAVDVRIIASTGRDLKVLVKNGRFREDLYYRLSVMEIRLPPLRERREDIPLLVEHFIRKFNSELKRGVEGVDLAAMQRLIAYPWPGNVRELQNVIERGVLLAQDRLIGQAALPVSISGAEAVVAAPDDLGAALRVYEREHMRQVLATVDGNKREAARRLGIDPATLYRKLSADKAAE